MGEEVEGWERGREYPILHPRQGSRVGGSRGGGTRKHRTFDVGGPDTSAAKFARAPRARSQELGYGGEGELTWVLDFLPEVGCWRGELG